METIPWMAAFLAANLFLCGSLAGEVARLSLRKGRLWRYFFLAPFVLAAMCIPAASIAYVHLDKVGDQAFRELILVAAGGSCFLAFAMFSGANPSRARQNADRSHAWTSWIDGDVFKKKEGSIRLAAAHRNTSEMIVVTTMQASIAMLWQVHENVLPYHEKSPEHTNVLVLALVSVVAPGVLMWLTIRLSNHFNSHRALIAACLSKIIFENEDKANRDESFVISRWRTGEHRYLFFVADALERCLPRIRKRYPKEQYKQVSQAYGALAQEIRNEATRVRTNKGRVGVLLAAATTLPMNDDLVATCKRLPKILTVEVEQLENEQSSRLGRALMLVDDALARHSRVVMALGVVALVVYFLLTGQIDKLAGFVQTKVGG